MHNGEYPPPFACNKRSQVGWSFQNGGEALGGVYDISSRVERLSHRHSPIPTYLPAFQFFKVTGQRRLASCVQTGPITIKLDRWEFRSTALNYALLKTARFLCAVQMGCAVTIANPNPPTRS